MGRFSDEPKDGHHIFDGTLDYYYDAKEHCYYYLDEKKQRCYTSAGFIEIPGCAKVISCPICRACINQICVNYRPMCGLLNKFNIDLDVLGGRKFLCKYFKPNKDSYDYELVMDEIKQAKNKS